MRNFTFRWLLSLLVIMGFAFTANAQYLTESFEGTFPPTGWTILNDGTGNDWTLNTNATYASDGTNSMAYLYNGSQPADVWAFTPAVNLTAGSVVQIIFDYVSNSSSYAEKLKLTVGSAADVVSQTETLYDNTTISNTTFITETVTYIVPADGDYYFAYNCYSIANQYNLFIDNIKIQEAPTCLEPSALTVSGITETEAVLSWNPGAFESTWNVEYGIAGFTPGTGTPATATDTFLAVNSLSGSTDYEFYVQADCGAGDLSYLAGPSSFSTTCGIAVAPYTQTFENSGSIPNCWEQGVSNAEDWNFSNSLSSPGHVGNAGNANGTVTTSGGYFAWVDDSSTDNIGTTMESPMIDISGLTVPALSFYLLSNNEGHSNAELEVDVWDGTIWNNVYTNQANTADWEEILVDLSAFSGIIQLRFVVNELTASDFYDDIAIDDISVIEAPTCFKPLSLMADESAFSAVLSWTPGSSETNFYIEYGDNGFTQGTGTISSVADTFYTATSLTPTTNYEFYVQADCGSGDYSLWAGPYSFTTLLSCQFPSDLTSSNVTNSTATLSWMMGDVETNWNVEYGEDGFAQGTGTTAAVTDTFLNISSLATITTYQFYVQADCGSGDLSPWSGPYTFTTTCVVATAPFTETFENGGLIPDCWAHGNSNSEDWKFNNTLSGPGHVGNDDDANGTVTSSGGYFAWVDDSSPDNTGTTMESPLIDISGLTVPALSFYILSHNEGFSNAELQVDVWDGSMWNNVYTNQANTAGWEEIFIDLSAFSGIIQVRFVVNELTPSDFYDDIAIDDVSVMEAPSCFKPLNLTAYESAFTADLSWTAGSSETDFNIEYGLDGFTQGTGTTTSITGTLYTATSLSPTTDYDFYVQADCGSGDLSLWAGPYSFKTLCDIFTPNYAQGFEGAFTPDCWEQNSGDISGPTGTPGSSDWTTRDLNGTTVASIYLYGNGDANWLLTPSFDLSAGGVYLTFDVAVSDYSGAPATMGSDDEIKLMFTTDNGATWIAMKTWDVSTAPGSDGDHFAIDMSPLPSANVRFAFWSSEGTVDDTESFYFAVDNFELRPVSIETDIITYSFDQQAGPATIDASAHTVDIEVGDGIDLTNLVADFTLSPYGTALVGIDQQFSGTTANNFQNPVIYTVMAEDGSTSQDWTVTVTNAAVLTEADIIDFSFTEQTAPATIDAANLTVDIEINWMAELTSLNPTIDLSYGATTNQSYTDFSSPVQYTVVAEDGVTTLIWTVTVTQEGLPQGARCIDPLPLTLPVVGEAGNTALFGNDYSSSMVCGGSYMNGDDIVYEFTITAPSLLSCNFTTTDSWPGIFVLDGCPDDPASQCIISETASGQSLSFNDEYITPGTYFFIISSYPSPQSIDFIFDLSAVITLNNEAEFLTYSIPTQSSSNIIASNDSIRVAMPAGTDLSALIADFTISNAAVDSVNGVAQATGVTPNNWMTTNPVVHTVTAEDGTIRNWSVWVETAGDEAEMLTFAFADETAPATFDIAARTVSIEVNYLADITNMTANYTLSYGATTTQTETNFTAPVVYTILSEDGLTTNDWTVTVTQEATPLGALCSNPIVAVLGMNTADNTLGNQWFSFTAIQDGDLTVSDCAYATNDTRLYVYSDCPAVTEIVNEDDNCAGGAQEEATFSIVTGSTYYIMWGDNYSSDIFDFELTFTGIALSDEAEILTYTLPGQDESNIVAASDSISVIMPYGSVFPFTLAAEFTLSAMANAEVATVPQVSTTTDNTWADNMTPVVYDITAEDGTTIRSWSVYVDIAPVSVKSVNNNNDVTVYPNPNNGLFNITLNLDVKTVDMLVVNMQGQTVANFKNVECNSTQSIDLSHVASGVYYIRVSSDNETIIKKVNILN